MNTSVKISALILAGSLACAYNASAQNLGVACPPGDVSCTTSAGNPNNNGINTGTQATPNAINPANPSVANPTGSMGTNTGSTMGTSTGGTMGNSMGLSAPGAATGGIAGAGAGTAGALGAGGAAGKR